MANVSTSPRRRVTRKQEWIVAGVAFVVLVLVGLQVAARHMTSSVHDRIIAALEDHFQSRVELKSLDVTLFPSARVTASGLVLKHKRRTDVPPLITIDRLTADTSLLELLRTPTRISQVRLQGLEIHVIAGKVHSGEHRSPGAERKTPQFVISEVVADGTVLETIPKS